jgi:hypothetical protein
MAKKKIRKSKPSLNKAIKYKKPAGDLFSYTDRFFEHRGKMVFWTGLILTCLLGALLFDLRISDGSDDSDYIMAAHNFIRGKSFPDWHGSLYPLFLCLPILVFGVNLFLLKLFSFFFMAGHYVVFFHTFRNRVRPTILAFAALFTAISSNILFFSSSTYSESLYFLLQALAIFYFFRIIDNLKTGPDASFPEKKLWIIFGLLAFLLSITRNVGLGIVIAFVLYFLLNRQFRALLYGAASFLIFQIPYSLYRNIFWKLSGLSFGGQLDLMFQKNAYNPALGSEDFMGFVARFLRNSDLYLSKHMFKVLGLRAMDSDATGTLLTLVVCILFVAGLIVAFRKKNLYMQFISLYLAIAISSTFLTQQVSWDQVRLIVVFIPILLILIPYGLYEISQYRYLKIIQPLLLAVLAVSFLSTFYRTAGRIHTNWGILKDQVAGKKYSGFTPDWVHYFQASEWAATNLPGDAVIGTRKPSMSFIYSKGRDFFGIYKLPVIEKDSMISALNKRNAGVIILDNFELGEKKFPERLFDPMRVFIRALFISEAPKIYSILEPPPERRTEILRVLAANNITALTDLVLFKEVIDKPEMNFFAVDPDQLVRNLEKNKVRFMIMGNLRYYSNAKDGRIVSTIQKYVFCASWKFPSMFRRIYQAGNEDDEPAEVLEINYPWFN